MSTQQVTDSSVRNERLLAASPGTIFRAFESPDLLAQWWGPKDFSNTFEEFDFQEGGHWRFTMHAPTGANFPNESVFRSIECDRRIILEHVVQPHFTLEVTLAPQGEQTLVTWVQTFQSAEFAAKMHDFLYNANNENLDRLEAVLHAQA